MGHGREPPTTPDQRPPTAVLASVIAVLSLLTVSGVSFRCAFATVRLSAFRPFVICVRAFFAFFPVPAALASFRATALACLLSFFRVAFGMSLAESRSRFSASGRQLGPTSPGRSWFLHTPPGAASTHESSVHSSPSSQFGAGPLMHWPVLRSQLRVPSQARESWQTTGAWTQPVAGSQRSVVQPSPSSQVGGVNGA